MSLPRITIVNPVNMLTSKFFTGLTEGQNRLLNPFAHARCITYTMNTIYTKTVHYIHNEHYIHKDGALHIHNEHYIHKDGTLNTKFSPQTLTWKGSAKISTSASSTARWRFGSATCRKCIPLNSYNICTTDRNNWLWQL